MIGERLRSAEPCMEKLPEGCVYLSQIPKLENPEGANVPLYVQIYDVFYDLIRNKVGNPGDLIPGENMLAAHFEVSRGTVRQALRYLEEDGLLFRSQGKGTEIANLAGHMTGGLQGYCDVCRDFCIRHIDRIEVSWEYTGSGRWISEQLQMTKGALMIVANLRYYDGDTPCAISQRLIPAARLEDFAVNAGDRQEMKAFLTDSIIQSIARSKAEIMIVTEAVPELESNKQTPCLSINEIGYDAQERPMAQIKNYLRSDCYRLYMSRKRRALR